MFHSILISGSNQAQRLEKFRSLTNLSLKPNPDLHILEPEPSITIKQIRSLNTFLAKKPYVAKLKTVLILKADKLTQEAQHALLKTLEEPPANSQIILLTPTQSSLLPTIISRCHLITIKATTKLTKDQLKTESDIYKNVSNSSLGQRVNLSLSFAGNKQAALEFCQLQLLFLKPKLKKYPDLVKKITQAINQLNANINPKLVIESLLFSYPLNR